MSKKVGVIVYTGSNSLVIDENGRILLLIKDDAVVIDKHRKKSFSCDDGQGYKHPELFEFGKVYLNFNSNINGFTFKKLFFYKDGAEVKFLEMSLPVDIRNASFTTEILTRKQLDEKFNSANFDSMFLFHTNGEILYARSKKNNIEMDTLGLSGTEIKNKIKFDNSFEKYIGNLFRYVNGVGDGQGDIVADCTQKNTGPYKIWGPALGYNSSSHMLLTIKNGKLDLKWVNITLLVDDTFEVKWSPIKIARPDPNLLAKYGKPLNDVAGVGCVPEDVKWDKLLSEVFFSDANCDLPPKKKGLLFLKNRKK